MRTVSRVDTNRSSSRGFSLFELVIASGLSAAFAAVVGAAFVSTSSLARDSLNTASMGQDVRQVADAATRYLTGASPAGTCGDFAPPAPAPIEACTVIAETPDVFLTATPLAVKFYSYTRPPEIAAGTDRTVLTAPDIIEMKYENNSVTITRQEPPSDATYTNPNGSTARPDPETVRAFDTEPLTVLFRYYDSAGNQLGCPEPALAAGDPAPVEGPIRCTDPEAITVEAELQSIALVEAMPRSTRTVGGETETFGIDILVSVDRSGAAL